MREDFVIRRSNSRVFGPRSTHGDSMPEKFDVLVCNPNAGISKDLKGIYIQFDVISAAGQRTGKSHAMAMRTPDAMLMLVLLEYLQRKFSLPKPTDESIKEAVTTWDLQEPPRPGE
jgi:hypothetical protein